MTPEHKVLATTDAGTALAIALPTARVLPLRWRRLQTLSLRGEE